MCYFDNQKKNKENKGGLNKWKEKAAEGIWSVSRLFGKLRRVQELRLIK